MDLQISTQKDNAVLSRNEVTAKVQFEGATPARKDIQKALAKALKAKENMVIIQQIKTEFGSPFATISAYAYSDETAMTRLERKNLLEKHAGHEPAAPAED